VAVSCGENLHNQVRTVHLEQVEGETLLGTLQ
jgi:hypothetical protein